MEEVNTTVETVETQPQETTEETTPAAEAEEVTAEATEQTSDETTVETTNAETAPAEEEALFSVKFNGQVKHLSRQDAAAYAQKGMNYDRLLPVLDSLKYVAASEGKSLVEFAESIRKQHEDRQYEALVDRCNGDEELAKTLLEVEKGKNKAAFESLIASEQQKDAETDEAVTKRLADELVEARAECPEITEYSKLPAAVRREAEEKGVHLLDAYLRFQHRERKKADAAKAEQAAASKASMGALASKNTDEGTDPVIAAMRRGIWGQ